MPKRFTTKQIERQLKTWKTKSPDIYNKIMEKAQKMGALTPTGKLTKAKRNKQQAEAFRGYYSTYVGSYSQKKSDIKTIKKEYEAEHPEDTMTFSQFESKYQELNDLLSEMWETMYEEFGGSMLLEEQNFLNSLSIDDAINRLRNELQDHRIFDIEQYSDKYGGFPNAFKD